MELLIKKKSNITAVEEENSVVKGSITKVYRMSEVNTKR